jgi:ABC-2 type transport system ATP-binding protein
MTNSHTNTIIEPGATKAGDVILRTTALTKRFGTLEAVKDLNIEIRRGEVFGFLGPNGAGKTTTMRMLVTLLRPDAGEILVGGQPIGRSTHAVRRMIGYMPDFFGVYNDMTVYEYLDFFGACYRIPPVERPRLISDLLELVDLGPRRDDSVDTLSRGLKQRLGLARVLVHDPSILVLDEPASGLDPRARVEVRELLLEIARLGKTILFSSHILADVAELCSRVGIMEGGKMVAIGTLDELSQQQARPRHVVRIGLLKNLPTEEAQAVLASLPGISSVQPQEGLNRADRLSFEAEFEGDDEALRGVLEQMLARGLAVVHFSEEAQNLEDVFMRTTRGLVS